MPPCGRSELLMFGTRQLPTYRIKGYCVDTVSVDVEMIRRYVKHQKNIDRNLEIKF